MLSNISNYHLIYAHACRIWFVAKDDHTCCHGHMIAWECGCHKRSVCVWGTNNLGYKDFNWKQCQFWFNLTVCNVKCSVSLQCLAPSNNNFKCDRCLGCRWAIYILNEPSHLELRVDMHLQYIFTLHFCNHLVHMLHVQPGRSNDLR